MYTILVNEANELVTTVRERIMQRSKLVDNLHFLVEPTYKGINMSDFTVMLEYLTPVSHEYHTEILVKSDELYKDRLEFKLPFDTNLTREAGDIQVQLTFVKLTMDADGNNVQQVRKTSAATIKILPITAWSDVVADSALTSLDQRLIQTQAMLEATQDMANYLDFTKADNMVFNKEQQYLQLTANGTPIGNQIPINNLGVGIVSIEVDDAGNLIVHHSDGRSENIGKVGSDSCVGVYIPHYSQDGIMTFTLKEKPEEANYSFDIDPYNNWAPVEGVEQNSTYLWEEL